MCAKSRRRLRMEIFCVLELGSLSFLLQGKVGSRALVIAACPTQARLILLDKDLKECVTFITGKLLLKNFHSSFCRVKRDYLDNDLTGFEQLLLESCLDISESRKILTGHYRVKVSSLSGRTISTLKSLFDNSMSLEGRRKLDALNGSYTRVLTDRLNFESFQVFTEYYAFVGGRCPILCCKIPLRWIVVDRYYFLSYFL